MTSPAIGIAFIAVEQKLRRSYYPSWLIHLLGHGLGTVNRFSRYPLADQADSLSCRPLFVVSAGRSGTTLLRSMLVAGGEIAIPPESNVLPMSILRFPLWQSQGWEQTAQKVINSLEAHEAFPVWEVSMDAAHEAVRSLPEKERSLARIIDEIFKCYTAQKFPSVGVWGDQTPLNTYYLPWILRVFPKARYLHIVRDGRDTIASYLEKGEKEGRHNRKAMLAKHSRAWAMSIQETQRLERRLQGTDQFLEIRYEQLVSNPKQTLEQVCAFAGIPHHPDRMLQFHKSSTTVEHKYQQHHANLSKPLFTSSIGRWTERLQPEEQAYVVQRIGPLLEKLGYE